MKILQINSFYYNRGGDCTHMFGTTKLLEKHGHVVIPFSMKHPLNFDSNFQEYWPSFIDYKEAVKNKNIKTSITVITRSLYSLESKKCISRILDDHTPEIAHIHNIHHHITPSILSEIKKRNIPIVWTLHDYTILCPNTSFLTEGGEICESCKKTKYFMAPIKRCKKNSVGASTVAMLENYFHRIIDIYRHVDLFISPSDFLRNKFIEYGMGDKVVTLNNFIDVKKIIPNYSNAGYIIYIGRLNKIKGVGTLVEAVKGLPGIRLKVVGDGELFESFKRQNIPNIEFLGFKTGNDLHQLLSNSMFAVVPSEWYENFPYSVLEPMAFGKPVIGANIGGIPELLRDGETGLLFESGNMHGLREKISYLAEQPDATEMMGRNARRYIENSLNEDIHYKKLMEIYDGLIGEKRH
jgi:glycosyltransferase involved in cell wall biosynthesis